MEMTFHTYLRDFSFPTDHLADGCGVPPHAHHRGTVRKMRIYNDKEIPILKTPTSP